jgi:hypothetical protein
MLSARNRPASALNGLERCDMIPLPIESGIDAT